MFWGFSDCFGVYLGARSGNRTRTPLLARDFKSLVSTDFTIRAEAGDYTCPGIEKRESAWAPSLFRMWSGRRVSNSRPIPWQGIALPTELLPRETVTGGASRSRTDLHGFAIRCITALLSRQAYLTIGTAVTGKANQPLFAKSGAGEESRTLDLYLGKVSLYQLSYSRVKRVRIIKTWRKLSTLSVFFDQMRPRHAHVIAHRPERQYSCDVYQPGAGLLNIETIE